MNNVIARIKEWYVKLVISEIKNTEEIPSVDEWMAFLDKLGHDDDPIAESYRKYACRCRSLKPGKRLFLNLLFLVYMCLRPAKVNPQDPGTSAGEEKAVLVERLIKSDPVFPESLRGRFSSIVKVEGNELNGRELSQDAYELFRKVRARYRLHPYYLMLVRKDLVVYSYCMLNHRPDALILYDSERDVATPLITALMERRGRKLISFMHGEYLLQLIQAHMCFSEYHLWHESYIPMFRDQLRCNIGKYVVYTPEKLRKKWHLEDSVPDHFFTYYMSGESTQTVRELAAIVKRLKQRGLVCKVRPHPRYSHWDMIRELFDPEQIEDSNSVDMKTSLASAEYVVGMSTTVLTEAYNEGKPIAIDDVTNPAQYVNLEKRNSLSLQWEHRLLSELIAQAEGQ